MSALVYEALCYPVFCFPMWFFLLFLLYPLEWAFLSLFFSLLRSLSL